MTRLPDAAEVERRVAGILDEFERGESELLGESGRLPVELVAYSEEWPRLFDSYRIQLVNAIGPAALRIDHVGSTSIPRIAAKPIIDIQVSVADVEDEDSYRSGIESLGWPLRSREPAVGHRYFRDAAGAPRRAHIHVCQVGSRWERDHLLFRDYLRTHPDRAGEYEAIKRAAREIYGDAGIAYTEAKGPFIEETLALAGAWATDTGWTP